MAAVSPALRRHPTPGPGADSAELRASVAVSSSSAAGSAGEPEHGGGEEYEMADFGLQDNGSGSGSESGTAGEGEPGEPDKYTNVSLAHFRHERATVTETLDADLSMREKILRGEVVHSTVGLCLLICRLVLYIFSTVMYITVAAHDDIVAPNTTSLGLVERSDWMFIVQLVVALLTLGDSAIAMAAEHTLWTKRRAKDGLNLALALPLFLGRRNVYTPTFLHIWVARHAFERIIKERQHLRGNDTTYEVFRLGASLICIILSAMCAFEHLDTETDERDLSLFDAFYFSLVTVSTVGYGDISPVTTGGRLVVLAMIVVAIVLLPTQFERLTLAVRRSRETGGKLTTYGEAFVVVIAGNIRAGTLSDLLHEIESEPWTKNMRVIVLSTHEHSQELVFFMERIHDKIRYLRGDALSVDDLRRARVASAKAVFILADAEMSPRGSDAQNILRAWAINDFAPNVKQYVQILLPESTIHLKQISGRTLCTQQLKYAMLAYSSYAPGVTTLITQLSHFAYHGQRQQRLRRRFEQVNRTLKELKADASASESQIADLEEQMKHIIALYFYAECSSNEIYSAKISSSRHFKDFAGMTFGDAALQSLLIRITLLGLRFGEPAGDCPGTKRGAFNSGDLIIHPGADTVLQPNDVVYYLGHADEKRIRVLQHGPEVDSVEQNLEEGFRQVRDKVFEELKHYNAPPPLSEDLRYRVEHKKHIVAQLQEDILYLGSPHMNCYMSRDRRMDLDLRSLSLDQIASKKEFVIADFSQNSQTGANTGIYCFIATLRRARHTSAECFLMRPILLLLSDEPHAQFLDFIALFPDVWYYVGGFRSIHHKKVAQCLKKAHSVVLLKDLIQNDQTLADAQVILASASIRNRFPSTNIVAELNARQNIRFMKYQALDSHKLGFAEDDVGSFLHRYAFASGSVFSDDMLNTLLFQSFTKKSTDIIEVMSQMIGIAREHSHDNEMTVAGDSSACPSIDGLPGYLATVLVDEQLLNGIAPQGSNYDSVYRYLVKERNCLPIGLYSLLAGSPINLESRAAEEAPPATDSDFGEAPTNKRGRSIGRLKDEAPTHRARARRKRLLADTGTLSAVVLMNPRPSTPLKVGDKLYCLVRPNKTVKARAQTNLDVEAEPGQVTKADAAPLTSALSASHRHSAASSMHLANGRPSETPLSVRSDNGSSVGEAAEEAEFFAAHQPNENLVPILSQGLPEPIERMLAAAGAAIDEEALVDVAVGFEGHGEGVEVHGEGHGLGVGGPGPRAGDVQGGGEGGSEGGAEGGAEGADEGGPVTESVV